MIGCEACVDGLQADGETPCPCQDANLPMIVRNLKRELEDARERERKLAGEVSRLRKALKYYADVSKYKAPFTGGFGALWADCGQTARKAIRPTPSE